MDKSAFGMSPARRDGIIDIMRRVLEDPLLSRVVEAWPRLASAAREAIVDIVEDAAREEQKHADR